MIHIQIADNPKQSRQEVDGRFFYLFIFVADLTMSAVATLTYLWKLTHRITSLSWKLNEHLTPLMASATT